MSQSKYVLMCILIVTSACSFASKSTDGKSFDNYRTEKKFSNSIGMEFVYVPPGTFIKGSPLDEPGRKSDEKQQWVTLTNGFYMQTTEVTQGQWKAIMGVHRSISEGALTIVRWSAYPGMMRKNLFIN